MRMIVFESKFCHYKYDMKSIYLTGSARNGSRAESVPGNKTGSQSTLTSIDSLGELPSTGSQKNRRPNSRQKNRESYLEAVSMGSFDGSGSDRYSVTTDPVDL